jgi:sporulation protein YlmC with PRC-barrel domain
MRKGYEDEIKGRTVIDGEGRAIGEVVAVFIDTESWSIDRLRVKVRRDVAKDLELEHRALRGSFLDLPTAILQAATDTILLRVPIRELVAPPSPPPPAVH